MIYKARKRINAAKSTFYDGGHSFGEVYANDIKEIESLEAEFLDLHIILASGTNPILQQ